jgi:6-phosphofructokinase 1
MVGIVNGETKPVPLAEVAGKLKVIDPKCSIINEAKATGISFGD